jgi:gliding motility-associated-like protein
LVTGAFVADSAYEYVCIGNFFDDMNTDTISLTPTSQFAYYYIDGINVSEVDLSVPNVFTPNGDGINDLLKIDARGFSELNCKIFNKWGTRVYEFIGVNDAWDGHSTSGKECAEGIYFYIIKAVGVSNEELFETGFIQLMR